MQKTIFIILVYFFYVNTFTAQVLYNETFDTYTLGNLGTDVTGTTAGQGGWLTKGATNANYAIIAEPNKGKVLNMFANMPQDQFYGTFEMKKEGLKALINQRAVGNEVFKVEFDIYTGLQIPTVASDVPVVFAIHTDVKIFNNTTGLFSFQFDNYDGRLNFFSNDGNHLTANDLFYGNKGKSLNFSTWYTVIVYVDYPNDKIYVEIPAINTIRKGDFLVKSTSTNTAQDFKFNSILINTFTHNIINTITIKHEARFDNVKITAIQSVPAHVLSTNEVLNEQFNVYPNPATNVVNISNSATIAVNKVVLYDVSGKLLKEETYNSTEPIQVNVANLPSGTYVFHIETDQGTAVKKVVKQ